MIAPDLAERFEGQVLEAEEARAARRTTLTMWEDDEGTCHGRFRIPSPAQARRQSQVLDVGRKRRLHSEGMRVAVGVRDGGCTTEGCETPPGLCHAHHDVPYSEGGATSVKNGRLLCPHHRRIHDPRYQTARLPDGKVRFHRRE